MFRFTIGDVLLAKTFVGFCRHAWIVYISGRALKALPAIGVGFAALAEFPHNVSLLFF
jgi:hypothetical protein